MKVLKHIIIGLAVCFIFDLLKTVIFFWDDTYSDIMTTLLGTALSIFYYFPICFAAFFVTISLLKNPYLLLAASVGAIAYHYYSSIIAAENINLSSKVNGYELFTSGKITFIGVLDTLITPFFVLFVYALVLIVRKNLTRT